MHKNSSFTSPEGALYVVHQIIHNEDDPSEQLCLSLHTLDGNQSYLNLWHCRNDVWLRLIDEEFLNEVPNLGFLWRPLHQLNLNQEKRVEIGHQPRLRHGWSNLYEALSKLSPPPE